LRVEVRRMEDERASMKREALLYDKLSESRVQCRTCLRRCVIPEGKAGWCRTRINEEGNLYTLIYGEVSSLSVNPIERKPVFHFLPGSPVTRKWRLRNVRPCLK